MNILVKAVIGGLMTALIAWLSTKGNVLPGIVPLFPTLTLISLYIVGTKGDPQGFQETCAATLKTLPAYAVFVVICYFAIRRVGFRAALLLGLAGWLVAALLVFLAPRAWQRLG
jgi:membrane protein GlpM